MYFYQMHKEMESIRADLGNEEADRVTHGLVGGMWGMVGGAAQGAVVGSIVPGVGTGLGAAIGGVAGLCKGVQDKTLADNARTGFGLLNHVSGWLRK